MSWMYGNPTEKLWVKAQSGVISAYHITETILGGHVHSIHTSQFCEDQKNIKKNKFQKICGLESFLLVLNLNLLKRRLKDYLTMVYVCHTGMNYQMQGCSVPDLQPWSAPARQHHSLDQSHKQDTANGPTDTAHLAHGPKRLITTGLMVQGSLIQQRNAEQTLMAIGWSLIH